MAFDRVSGPSVREGFEADEVDSDEEIVVDGRSTEVALRCVGLRLVFGWVKGRLRDRDGCDPVRTRMSIMQFNRARFFRYSSVFTVDESVIVT